EEEELVEIALGIFHLRERQRTALFLRQDPFERFVSCLVFIPRDRYNTELRTRIQNILERAFDGRTTAFYTLLAEHVHARIQFYIKTTPGKVPTYDPKDVEAALVEASRSWSDHLHDALVEAKGEERGLALVRRYREAFPASYRERTIAPAAIFDIDRVEEVIAKGGIALNLYRPIEAEPHALFLKLYQAGAPMTLSAILPILEHLGVQVIGEHPHEILPRDRDAPVWVHDFVLQSGDGSAIDLDSVKEPFQTAFARIWDGEMEDDRFNRLVLIARLAWREVVVLRAYARYLRQARVPFSQDALAATLAAYPRIAGDILALFHARFDPEVTDRDSRIAATEERLDAALEAVENLDEDRMLRRFINAVSATVRTNYFQPAADGQPKPYLAVKLRSADIIDLPQPHPWREVFVYAPRMEGVHLRGGPVARGGIRWSDRREDFRTEILDLMKAQMVKNGVIVPVGSKGGFVVKRPPPAAAGREAVQEEGVACYRWLMQGMLDLTDTRDQETILPPAQIVRHDEDDPYLVVAADKGTATFSDTANGIARDYGFWLDDAFASGGSAGYDHKKMGITARGAWESVKRHFREVGVDIQTEDVTVIGVGDMSGDVFGNGMLLSRHIRLLAAFNHLHIFVDPDPDPETSWAERQRLFELGRGSWDQYDRALLSEGGGVFDRRAKAVRPTARMRQRFGISRDSLTPNELIAALLKAEVDLLWFGGIGTYVKARSESHAAVGDKANDPLRVDGAELRARVVGEGANLALTQLGRIEAAQRGCRLNTDFIDNSAGVDCSDHEVNIKILLGAVVRAGDLTMKQRNQVLEEMTDEVAALVLRDNYLQSQAISLVMAEGPEALERFARMIRALEKAGRLNRALENLPDEEEIGDRLSRREGLTRPEQAVLLSYGKIGLFDDLMASALPDEPGMEKALAEYFPSAIRRRFPEAMAAHPLRREIIATAATNALVNRMGPSFVGEVGESTGMAPADIARCYVIARDSFAMRDLWQAIEALDTRVTADVQLSMLLATRRLMERAIEWLFRYGGERPSIAAAIERYAPAIHTFEEQMDSLLPEDARADLADRAAHWRGLGVPEDLARRIAGLAAMAAALDLIRVASACEVTPAAVAPLYFELGSVLGVAWLRERAQRLPATGHWQKQAAAAVVDELFALQADLAAAVLRCRAESDRPDYGVGDWLEARRPSVERIYQLIADLKSADTLDLAMLAVAARRLRALVV
ncbi:MAG: NAD-glutamate dehydrogenase, partial [Alphaproteobacteria bacterium]|nr:NAD-glutamate dehydrogenase [Alphaproteobacteria bacterium]